MEQIRLSRTGESALTFTGHLIKKASGHWFNGKDQTRWHDLKLYQTEKSRTYILAVTFRTLWQGEAEQFDVVQLGPHLAGLPSILQGYNPVLPNIGYPINPHYADKQRTLEQGLKIRWQALVSAFLDGLVDTDERIE